MHRDRRRRDPFFVMLLVQLFHQINQLEYKPPVTIALLIANIGLFYDDFLPPSLWKHLPTISSHCLQPAAIIRKGRWSRLVLSAFLHADEGHIYYNMSSLLWKGVQLEQRLGSLRFGALVGELLLVSHSLVVLASYWLGQIAREYRYLYRSSCAVGFSAVLFGLKVVLNWDSPGTSSVMGIMLPTKYLCWAELFIASMFNPNVSFLGHLCGILAGLLHLRATQPTIRYVTQLLAASRRHRGSARGRSRREAPRFSSNGASGYGSQGVRRPGERSSSSQPADGGMGGSQLWGHASTTPGTSPQWQQQSAADEAGGAGGTTTGPLPPPSASRRPVSEEELRIRRLMRFDNR